MPRLEHIESNAALAFKPMSARQRRHLDESIESGHTLAMRQYFCDHQDA